jgi:hypothetical protein
MDLKATTIRQEDWKGSLNSLKARATKTTTVGVCFVFDSRRLVQEM